MKTRELVLAAVFAALIAIIAPVSIPLGIVPITLQTVIVPLIASITTWRIGLSAVVVYLLLGLIGMPVFAGWASGIGVLLGPTGGYLLGLVLFPLIISTGLRWQHNWLSILFWNAIAAVIQLIIGSLWLSVALHISVISGLLTGTVAFALPTLVKVIMITVLAVAISKTMRLPIGR